MDRQRGAVHADLRLRADQLDLDHVVQVDDFFLRFFGIFHFIDRGVRGEFAGGDAEAVSRPEINFCSVVT